MTENATVANLFDLAITAEHAAETLYQALAERFDPHTEVVAFWRAYAAEEADHARHLERIRDALNEATLLAPADPDILKDAIRALEQSVDTLLGRVHTLEDAYQLAHEMENAETNAVFLFLIGNFDQESTSFLRAQLESHVARIVDGFPERYRETEVRRAVPARA